MSRALLALLRCYQLGISPLLGHHCRFEPTCSQYAIEAVRHWGAMRGTRMAALRLCRCHPWGGTGFDPVPDQPSPPSTSDR